jgi:hypothetical protein
MCSNDLRMNGVWISCRYLKGRDSFISGPESSNYDKFLLKLRFGYMTCGAQTKIVS